MQLTILGGHQVSTPGGRATSFLIDDEIALDAGGLVDALTLDQQNAICSVLLTHYHFDHIRDLPFLGLAALNEGRQIDVYCHEIVREALQRHILSAPVWLDFFVGLDPEAPTFLHQPIEPPTPFCIGPYDVLPVDNRHHTVPVVGYQITTPQGRRLFYTGDTGPGIRDVWPLVQPDVLITEVTLGNQHAELAVRAGHLTPALLEEELIAFRDLKGSLPRVLVCHANQAHETTVRVELDEVARRLQATIEFAREGMRVDL